MRASFLALALLAFALPAAGDIEKLAVPCDTGLCFHWWPKLPSIDGWQHDHEHSLHYSMNALAPKGASFADADVVMYAKAIYKPRQPQTKSLAQLIEDDRKDFLRNVPGVKIEEVEPLTSGDGAKLRSLTFAPPASGGNWEQVTYGEEDDFYLIFTVSSRSAKGFEATRAAYRQLISRYKAKP